MRSLVFLSHNLPHPRNVRLQQSLATTTRIVTPGNSQVLKGHLKLNINGAKKLLYLGISSLVYPGPYHLDGIDLTIVPFIPKGRNYLLDFRCPLPVEANWNRSSPSQVISILTKYAIKKAKVVIAPNHEMLAYGRKFAAIKHGYVVPNFPRRDFVVDIPQSTARSCVDIAAEGQVCLFVCGARLREVYGFDLLLRTWKEVSRRNSDATLCIVGWTHRAAPLSEVMLDRLSKLRIELVGRVNHSMIPMYIAASDICLTQRTPGFPTAFYNDFDSLKIAEYAAFKKPIVAAGYLPSSQYLLAETNPSDYAAAILESLAGNTHAPVPRFWEDNRATLREAYSHLWSE